MLCDSISAGSAIASSEGAGGFNWYAEAAKSSDPLWPILLAVLGLFAVVHTPSDVTLDICRMVLVQSDNTRDAARGELPEGPGATAADRARVINESYVVRLRGLVFCACLLFIASHLFGPVRRWFQQQSLADWRHSVTTAVIAMVVLSVLKYPWCFALRSSE